MRPVARVRGWEGSVMASMSVPVAVLVVLGIILAVLGIFASAIQLTYVGIGAVVVAGILQVLGQRRS
jgi:hypothetical protein